MEGRDRPFRKHAGGYDAVVWIGLLASLLGMVVWAYLSINASPERLIKTGDRRKVEDTEEARHAPDVFHVLYD